MSVDLNALLNDKAWPVESLPAEDLVPMFSFRMLTPQAPKGRAVSAREVAVALDGGRPLPGRLLFPLQLQFESQSAGASIGFPYWETLSRMGELFDWLREGVDGESWSDVDQGWLFKAARCGDRLHFLDSAFDEGGECANLSVDRAAFLRRLDRAEGEARRVLGLA